MSEAPAQLRSWNAGRERGQAWQVGECATGNLPAEARRRRKGGLLWQARHERDGSVGDKSEAGAVNTTTQATSAGVMKLPALTSLSAAGCIPPTCALGEA